MSTCDVVSRTVSIALLLLSATVLFGWAVSSPVLVRMHPSWPASHPLTAMAFGLLSLTLISLPRFTLSRPVADGLALAVLLVAAAQVATHLLPDAAGIDELLFPRQSSNARELASRVSVPTALSLTVLATARLCADRRTEWLVELAQGLTLLTAMIGLVSIVGHALSLRTLYGQFTSVPTSIMILLASIALFVLTPSRGMMAALARRGAGALTLQITASVALLIPVVIGATAEWLRRSPRANAQVGLFVEAAVIGVVVLVAGAMTARSMHRLEVAREKALHELADANADLEARVEARTRELRNKEEELVQAQKMEAVGRLAGGVAHDFNNLLTVITGSGELVLASPGLTDEHREDLQEVVKAGHRAAALTRQLLAFSRRQVMQPTILDINQTIGDMTKMLERIVGEDVPIEFKPAERLRTVSADPGQVEQVVANLVVNARDAMPKGGKVLIETANVELDEEYAAQHADATAGPHVMLAVSDTGTGMSRETIDRIFEPFFTTKGLGRGTGLGLSTVYGIVRQSRGNVRVYSEPGHGTTFKIYLPIVTAEPAAVSQRVQRAPPAGGTETILVVEDEPDVRKLIHKALTRAGYTVLLASDGEEALEVAAGRREGIDLLLTDVVLSTMSGRDLADRYAELCPNSAIVFMSGYTDDAIANHGILRPGTLFIEKPFTTTVLLGKLREYLG